MNAMKLTTLLLGVLLLTAAAAPAIDESFLKENLANGDRGGTPIDTVVLHFTSDVLQNPDDPFDVARNVAIFKQYGVSAHYMIARDGTIYRLVPDARRAAHAGRTTRTEPALQNMNSRSIGIELLAVGSEADMTAAPAKMMSVDAYRAFAAKHPDFIGFTDAQYAALNALLPHLAEAHPTFKLDRAHVLGHDEYAPERKNDPGELFEWSKLQW